MARVASARAVLGVVEAAYELDATPDEWLQRVIERMLPALDGRLGAFAYRFEITADRVMRLPSAPISTGPTPEGFAAVLRLAAEDLSVAQVTAFADPTIGLATGSQMASRGAIPSYDPKRWQAYAESVRLGVSDHLGATALDPNGSGFHVCVPRAEIGAVTRRESARWRLVMAHMSAGMRLLHAEQAEEAVLDPRGRTLHAEGAARSRSARDALRDAAVAIDIARSRKGREDPDAALRGWRALVGGRWSVIDRFDRDGRRFLVARKNDPDVSAPHALSRREAQVAGYAALGHTNKHIAYVLGIHPSTVSTHLRGAMLRIGARSHAELTELWSMHPAAGEAT